LQASEAQARLAEDVLREFEGWQAGGNAGAVIAYVEVDEEFQLRAGVVCGCGVHVDLLLVVDYCGDIRDCGYSVGS
jgi:hypothetical protein